MSADEEPTTIGFDYDSETASLTDEDRKHIEESIKNNVLLVQNLRRQPIELPTTVDILQCKNGTKVYLVGTAHFSQESIDEVTKIVSSTAPDFVVVELCRDRSHVLVMDEERIKQDCKNINLFNFLKTHGPSHGLLQYLLLRLNAYLISTLGMAPGGEFRAAAREAAKQMHCHIVLGDRPVGITLQRAFNALGPWTKLKLAVTLLLDFEPITKEKVEEMKNQDFLEQMIKEMAGEHPELTKILIDERDMYLTKSIWATTGMASLRSDRISTKADSVINSVDSLHTDSDDSVVHRLRSPLGDSSSVPEGHTVLTGESPSPSAEHVPSDTQPPCCPFWPSPSVVPRVVVAVVGIGHAAGIRRYWDEAETIDQHKLMTVIEPPLSWKLFRWSFRAFLLSAIAGLGYGAIKGSCKVGQAIYSLVT